MDVGKVINYTNFLGEDKKVVLIEKIGQGSFGVVFKGLLEGYGPIAVKSQNLSRSLAESINTEVKISKVLSPDVAIILRRVLLNPSQGKPSETISLSDDVAKNTVVTLYDFADGLEVQKLLDINKASNIVMTDEVVEQYVRNLLQCLEGLKTAGVAHRDIKPANLMLNRGNITLIDFGFACFYAKCTGKKGTPKFLPPEFYFLPEINWQKGDIFAVGITIVSLITNGGTLYEHYFSDFRQATSFFSIYSTGELEQKFNETLTDYSKKFPLIDAYRELILGMINPEPLNRWNLEQCFQWLDNKTYAHVLSVTE